MPSRLVIFVAMIKVHFGMLEVMCLIDHLFILLFDPVSIPVFRNELEFRAVC